VWTGFRAAAGYAEMSALMSAETSAPTSFLLFSTGWSLIVRTEPHLNSVDSVFLVLTLFPANLLEFFLSTDEFYGAVV